MAPARPSSTCKCMDVKRKEQCSRGESGGYCLASVKELWGGASQPTRWPLSAPGPPPSCSSRPSCSPSSPSCCLSLRISNYPPALVPPPALPVLPPSLHLPRHSPTTFPPVSTLSRPCPPPVPPRLPLSCPRFAHPTPCPAPSLPPSPHLPRPGRKLQ